MPDFSAFASYRESAGLTCWPVPEEQGSDYEAGIVDIDGESWHIRTARTTPTKPGAFVAFWTRDRDGETAPFPLSEVGAGLLVLVEQDGRRGVFTFTPDLLTRLGITGKRGFRVYPSWCTGLNASATAAQRAQAPAFRTF